MADKLSGSFEAMQVDEGIYGISANFIIDEKKIGSGQFSVVYKGICTADNNRPIAIKKVQLFQMMEAKARQDCLKEIDLLKHLDSPHVICYLGQFVENNELNIVLELADAGDLSRMIRHFKKNVRLMPERTVWKYFTQLCDGLAHMHERRVMHRDIKPANIFVTADGIVKLGASLGLARYFFSKQPGAAQSLVGTPYYMAPERISEKFYDFKADIWSLGCVLYELCALQSPFYGDKLNLFSLCKKIEKCTFPPLASDIYSLELRTLVDRCVQINPDARPGIEEVQALAHAMSARLSVLSASAVTQ